MIQRKRRYNVDKLFVVSKVQHDCRARQLDNSWPVNIAKEMNRQWPNLNKNESNDQFWDKQWRMHGSCAESVPGVQNIGEYFTKVITLANMYNIKEILNSSRITEGNQYPAATIQDAIVLSTTKLSKIIESKMRCAKNWLFEIRICFNKQFEVIDCPNVTNSTLKLTYPSKPSPAAQALRCDVSSNGHSTSQFLSLIAFLIAFPSFLLLKV
ncbi:ribonuclease Oy-like isoform X5 [Magallana gigas]